MEEQSLDKRLNIYRQTNNTGKSISNKLLFAASAVAGVGGMLIPPPAEAAIQYSGEKNWEVTKDDKSKKVDFDGSGGVFTFKMTFASTSSYTQQLAGVGGAGKVINDTGNGDPAKLNANYTISSNRSFASFGTVNLATLAPSVTSGNFLGKQGYLGVMFESNGNTHYGWIQYKASVDAKIGTIIDWAYEDTPDKAIKTGATKDSEVDPPEVKPPFSWNLFLPAILAGSKNK